MNVKSTNMHECSSTVIFISNSLCTVLPHVFYDFTTCDYTCSICVIYGNGEEGVRVVSSVKQPHKFKPSL